MKKILVLFDQDLRTEDNPAFFYAFEDQKKSPLSAVILPLFIIDEENKRPFGQVTKWFLHHALESFACELAKKFFLKLILKKGDSLKILAEIFAGQKIEALYFNRSVDQQKILLQDKIKKLAQNHAVKVFDFNAITLFAPQEIKNGNGSYFKVFTPFWKECLKNSHKIGTALPAPDFLPPSGFCSLQADFFTGNNKSKDYSKEQITKKDINLALSELKLLPQKKWVKKLEKIWEFDYKKIKKNFAAFLKNRVNDYKQIRNFPELDGTSKLSPYLHFGMLSVRQIFLAATHNVTVANQLSQKTESLINNSLQKSGITKNADLQQDHNFSASNNYSLNSSVKSSAELSLSLSASPGVAQFITELGWREFCHHLLFHFPLLPEKSFRAEFEKFPWYENATALQKWQRGQTGFPIVDAGMRELWTTGFMHNRVRMIVGSFLVKDLLIDWREGEKWFWDCLADANLASNVANWQWIAGSGADAAPYFRIFNPTLQGERFDPQGNYVRKWVPEIAKLPDHLIHKPWQADENLLKSCNIELEKDYPQPIVDHSKARDTALAALKSLKSGI